MSISRKLLLGFGILIVIAILQGGYAVKNSHDLGLLTKSMYDRSYMSMNFVRSAQSNFRSAQIVAAAGLNRSEIEDLEEFLEELADAVDLVIEDLDVANERATKQRSRDLIGTVSEASGKWKEIGVEGFKALGAAPDRAAAAKELEQKLAAVAEEIAEGISTLVEYTSEDGYVASQEAAAETDETVLLNIIAAGGAVGAGLLMAVVLGIAIARPLGRLQEVVGRLADGDTETEIPAIERKDEIGRMARAVVVFRDNLIETERLQSERREAETRARQDEERRRQEKEEADRKAQMERAEAEELALQQNRQQLLDFAQNFENRIKELVETVSTEAEATKFASQGMTRMMQVTGTKAETIVELSERASENVRGISTAAENLTDSIGNISSQALNSKQISERASEKASSVNDRVSGLANAAEKIGEVITMINDIASQTNLLALNATIEAARAGEAGKGFAVVATEVKSLADQTARATEDISIQIAAIQNSTGDAVTGITEIRDTILQVEEINREISTGIEAQLRATQEISENVNRAMAGANEVKDAVSLSAKTTVEFLASAEQLTSSGKSLDTEIQEFLAEVRSA